MSGPNVGPAALMVEAFLPSEGLTFWGSPSPLVMSRVPMMTFTVSVVLKFQGLCEPPTAGEVMGVCLL